MRIQHGPELDLQMTWAGSVTAANLLWRFFSHRLTSLPAALEGGDRDRARDLQLMLLQEVPSATVRVCRWLVRPRAQRTKQTKTLVIARSVLRRAVRQQ
jgi:hypothetical protein